MKVRKLAKLTAEGKENVPEPYSALKAGNALDGIQAQRFRREGVISVHFRMNRT